MPRIERIDVGEYVYHVINRANARVTIFDNPSDYKLFEEILEEGVNKFGMRILAYIIMPNHWHLVLYPKNNGDLAKFMGWVSNTHTRRWHTLKKTIGQGHLYQGRYKSFLVQDNSYFLTVVRYVERNALRAKLVKKAENWKWSSAWRRLNGSIEQKKMLSKWPVSEPDDYIIWLNRSQPKEEENKIKGSIIKNIPFGKESWVNKIVDKFGIGQTMRGVGRPKVK